MLQDLTLPEDRRYESKTSNEPLEFYLNCLCNSQKWDLLLGYFSSSAINVLSLGFASFIYNGGSMRLIINDVLSHQDKTLLENSEDETQNIPFDLHNLTKLKETLSQYDKHFFECLAWLIKNDRIQIKIIAPKENEGIAHYKSGQFFDDSGSLYFHGSCNMTAYGLLKNLEEINITAEWDNDLSRKQTQKYAERFNSIFAGKADNVRYLEVEQIKTAIRDKFASKDIDELLIQEKELLKMKEAKFHSNSKLQKIIQKVSSELDKKATEPKFPYPTGPREYQQIAFNNWKNNNQKGLFAMATGTGKTITSLNCLLEIYKRSGYYKAIILVPTITLLNQWEKECQKFNFNNIVKVYSKNSKWRADIDNLLLQEKINGKEDKTSYIIISTYASFAKENVFNILNEFSKSRLLLIADEAHNMGSGQIRNRLSAIKYGRRIGLSATPERQYDEAGNQELMSFFGSENEYTYEYSMKEAIEKGVLCRYNYYPHLVTLTEDEMKNYTELSVQIAKFSSGDGELLASDSILTRLLLARKRIIHKAENKKAVFEKILRERFDEKGNLKYTLVYVPEGNQPDEEADFFVDREYLSDDTDSLHLIDQYTVIVKNIHPKVTVKQFTSSSTARDIILDDFAKGQLDVLTSMKCLDEGVDVPRSELAIFCASTGNPRQFIQRRGRILRIHADKHIAFIHDLVVVPEINSELESYKLEKNMIKTELNRVRNFALLSENSSETISELDNILKHYNLSIF